MSGRFLTNTVTDCSSKCHKRNLNLPLNHSQEWRYYRLGTTCWKSYTVDCSHIEFIYCLHTEPACTHISTPAPHLTPPHKTTPTPLNHTPPDYIATLGRYWPLRSSHVSHHRLGSRYVLFYSTKVIILFCLTLFFISPFSVPLFFLIIVSEFIWSLLSLLHATKHCFVHFNN